MYLLTFLGMLTPPINQKKGDKKLSTQISTNLNYFQLKLIVLAGLNPGNQNCVSWFGTFQHRQDCVYGFSSLTLATRASQDVKEWFLCKSGEANQILFFILAEKLRSKPTHFCHLFDRWSDLS